ncbi:MAG: hypothetical protein ACRC8A_15215 [Microcoleaceae cyanobacterium]
MKPQNLAKKVQIADGIQVMTFLDDACIPALRSGFAGYPVNPRWNAVKFHAWKQGGQLRLAFKQGEMWVRPADSMLVPIPETEEGVNSPVNQILERVSSVTILLDPSNQQGELNLA